MLAAWSEEGRREKGREAEREGGREREREREREKGEGERGRERENKTKLQQIHAKYLTFCVSIFFTAHVGAPGGGREFEGCPTVLTFFATSPIVWCCCFVWSRSSNTPMNSSSSLRTELNACKVHYI